MGNEHRIAVWCFTELFRLYWHDASHPYCNPVYLHNMSYYARQNIVID